MPFLHEVNFPFYEKLKQKKNAVVPTYPDFFRKKNRSKKKSSVYLPTLFDFRALAETKLLFLALPACLATKVDLAIDFV